MKKSPLKLPQKIPPAPIKFGKGGGALAVPILLRETVPLRKVYGDEGAERNKIRAQ